MAGIYGANVAQLRALAQDFKRGSTALQFQSKQLSDAILATPGWSGPDAARFRNEWSTSHRQALLTASRKLEESAKVLLQNAKEQEDASAAAGGAIGGGAGGPGSKSPLETAIDLGKMAGKAVGITLGVLGFKDNLANSAAFIRTKKILDFAGDGLADLFKRGNYSIAEGFKGGEASKLLTNLASKEGWIGETAGAVGKFGRFAGPALAPFAIGSGIHDMISPEHDGARGVGDRIAGGLSVIGGGGTLLMAAGLLTNPVGIGIVVGAGVVAGAWALGNMIADSEWGKAAGHWIANTAGDAWNGAKSVASDAWNGAKNLASDAVDGAKKFFSNPIKSLGGLFG